MGDMEVSRRKKRKRNRKRGQLKPCSIVPEDLEARYFGTKPSFEISSETKTIEEGDGSTCRIMDGETTVWETKSSCNGGGSTLCSMSEAEVAPQIGYCNGYRSLRQRIVNLDGREEKTESSPYVENEMGENNKQLEEQNNLVTIRKLETDVSLDWKELMAEDPNNLFSFGKSPLNYFMDEMHEGNSLRSTTTISSESERERVYDTIFHLPWRCELLIDVGFFVCLDSFLSLLALMPTRIMIAIWRLLKTRQFRKPSAPELSDIGCFVVLASCVALLEQTDISLIYHMIRGQGTIKLYVVYNVLEIFDKLCQSFGGDVLEALFNSAEGLARCSPENTRFWMWRFVSDQALAVAASIVHSFVLLAQAITLSTCIVAHNNALLALLVSNNFAEIKSNVFKRFSKDNIHSLVYSDSIERFHISVFLLFVLAQYILQAEGPWFHSFLYNTLLVFTCEMLIDIIKHSFLAKFNDLKPCAYSEFLEELCNQALNIQNGSKKKKLTFVPLAPACMVIRVLSPVFAAYVPYDSFCWRFIWIPLLVTITYVMLASLKTVTGTGLRKYATWYLAKCRKKKRD